MALNTEKEMSGPGLRTRVTIVLFILISLLCIGITFSSYYMLKKQLTVELRARLINMAYTGSFVIDRKSLRTLLSGLVTGLDYGSVTPEGLYPFGEDKLAGIEKREDYLRVCADLNVVRDAQPDLLLYAYIIIPTAERGMFRFVADADAPSLLEDAAAGKGSTDDITRYGKLYEAGADSVMAESADKREKMVEKVFAWDDEGRSNILSGYAPVMDNGEFLGLLGLDISDKNANAILRKTLIVYVLISLAAIAASIFVSLLISRMISRPLRRLVSSLRDMADGEGDLTATLRVTGKDELGQAALEFNRFTGKLREVISDVKIIAADLNATTAAIRDSIDDLSSNLNLQTGLEQEVSLGSTNIKSSVAMLGMNADVQANGFIALTNRLMDLSRSIAGLADESKLASKLTGVITGNVIRGKESLQAASGIMASISKSSEEMTGIAGIISDISDQINLLSLNAAIESARAGEAGRGFAVVADEISKLADKTAYNVKDIDRIIQENSRLISGGMQSVNSMMELFGAVITDVGQISDLIEKINSYMNAQAEYNNQVHKESETMKSIVGEIHELIEEHGHSVESIVNSLESISRLSSGNNEASVAINTSAGEISSLTENLLNLMNYFKVGTDKWD